MWRYSFSQVEIAINTPVYKIITCMSHVTGIWPTHVRCIYARNFDKSSFSKLKFILNLYISSRFKVIFILFQGYNMNEDVFGQAEDFITLPKISQVFGEVRLGLALVAE